MTNPTKGKLQQTLKNGAFAVTCECGPPRGADVEIINKKIESINLNVDAINVTDNQTAIVRMSSIAASAHIIRAGYEPVMQMVVRDRNRIALQSDILGAWSLGIKNILCLSGDHQNFGNHPDALNVFDIDSMNLIRTVRDMREHGTDMSGFELKGAPQMFIGAAANPFADPFDYRVIRLAKKIDAGADFIQTQCIYNLDRFQEWLNLARKEGLSEKVYILGGVMPLKSVAMAKHMRNNVAGIDIPDAVIKRMEAVPKEKAAAEGLKICQETIAALREMKGIRGVHIMALGMEEKVAKIVKEAGLFPRPAIN
jgi:methylenetetrahydrofolate reductase (NADPH)